MDVRSVLIGSLFLCGCNTLANLDPESPAEIMLPSIADCSFSDTPEFASFQALSFVDPRVRILSDADSAVLAAVGEQGGGFTRFYDTGDLEAVEVFQIANFDDLSLSQDMTGFAFSVSSEKEDANGIDIAFGPLADQTQEVVNDGFTATASVGGFNPYTPMEESKDPQFVWASLDEILLRGRGILGDSWEHEGSLGSAEPGGLLSSPGPHVFHWSPTRLTAISVFGRPRAVSETWTQGQTLPTSVVYLGDNRYLFAVLENREGKIILVDVDEEQIEIQPAIESSKWSDLSAFSIFSGERFVAVAYVPEEQLGIDYYELEEGEWRRSKEQALAVWPEFRASNVQGAIFQDPEDRCSVQLWLAGVEDLAQIHVVHTKLAP